MYKISYINHLERLLKKKTEIGGNDQLARIEDILVDAFLYLDDDMGAEAHNPECKDVDNIKFVTVALSGAVGIVAHIEVGANAFLLCFLLCVKLVRKLKKIVESGQLLTFVAVKMVNVISIKYRYYLSHS